MANIKPNFGLQPLPKDERDLVLAGLFGQVDLSELPEEFSLGDPLTIKHQRDSDFCTAFGTCGMSEFQEGVELEPAYSFAVSKDISGDPESWGQNIRDAAKAHVKVGAIEVKDSPFSLENLDYKGDIRFLKNWPSELKFEATKHKKQSYFFIKGKYDAFDNIRAAIWQFREKKQAVGFGVRWAWGLDKPIVITAFDKGFGHFIYTIGWKIIEEKEFLIIVNSYGKESGEDGYFYFDRSVVNKWVEAYGAIMFVDLPLNELKERSLNMAEITKPYLASQTIQGMIKLAIPFLAMVAQFFGVSFTPEETTSFTDILVQLVVAASGVWGMIDIVRGRVNAKDNLKGVFK